MVIMREGVEAPLVEQAPPPETGASPGEGIALEGEGGSRTIKPPSEFVMQAIRQITTAPSAPSAARRTDTESLSDAAAKERADRENARARRAKSSQMQSLVRGMMTARQTS